MPENSKSPLGPPIYPHDIQIESAMEFFVLSISVDNDYYRFVISPEWMKRISLALNDTLGRYEKEVRKLDVLPPKVLESLKPRGLGFLQNIASTGTVVSQQIPPTLNP